MSRVFCYLTVFFLITSCSKTTKKISSTNNSIDYSALNSFVQDSLPDFINIDQNYNKVFNLWEDIKIIQKTNEIISSDPRQLSFLLEALKFEVKKINDYQIPGQLNVPQVIGRLRVYKTNIFKINSNKIELENIQLFKKNLKSIVISYNALIDMMNKIAKESTENIKVQSINLAE